MALIVFFVVLSAGGIFCAAVWDRDYEELLPVTSSFIVMFLFLSGICGNLKLGVYLIYFFAAAAYGAAIFWVVRKNCIKAFLRHIFSPGFFVFLFLYLILTYTNYGNLASSWDEFSHWADIVKAMAMLDDFGTNPASGSAYASYPPGMALLQYFMQKLHASFTGEPFCEWMLYFVYQVFFLTFLMPFFRNLEIKKPFGIVVSAVVIFLCPICIFPHIYTEIYIDPFLGVLSAAGFASVFLSEKKDVFYSANVLSICSMLVLAKAAGLLFAILLGCAYILDLFLYSAAQNRLYKYMCMSAALAAIAIPKILWSYNINANGAILNFNAPVDFRKLCLVLIGKDDSYMADVRTNFRDAIVTKTITVGNTSLALTYFTILVLLVLWIAILCHILVNKGSCGKQNTKLFLGMVCVQVILYIFGLCVTYMFKFSEYEATRLASFERYMNIICLFLWILATLLLLEAWRHSCFGSHVMTGAIIVCVMMVVVPMQQAVSYFCRTSVEASKQMRSQYDILAGKIEKIPENIPRIYIVSQESQGLDVLVMRYILRPRGKSTYGGSVGEAFYEGDIWTRSLTAEQWLQELMEGYDYVAILKLNDYFFENFSDIFVAPGDIEENEVYQINKQTQKLERFR